MKKIFFLLLMIATLQFDSSYAQSFSNLYITKQYKKKPLRDVISDLQQSYSLKFFFSDQQIDSVTVDANINHQVLEQALKMILRKSKISFYFDKDKIVLYLDEKKEVSRLSFSNTFTISGVVTDANTNESIPSVTIYIQDIRAGFVSDVDGRYVLKDIREGIYIVQYSFVGYGVEERKLVLDKDLKVDITLTEKPTELAPIEITSSLYEISLDESSSHSLSSKEIFHSPNLAKDITRTLRTLPGIGSNDYSAKPRIRGGSTDESVFYLDNFEIINPFHFEEFDGLFSCINSDYITHVKVIPGGFSPTYTDKLAGVIDMQTAGTVDNSKTSLSVDLINATLFTKQKINDKLDVQFSARRTYLDLVLGFNKDKNIQIEPLYLDAWGKVNYRLNKKNTFSFNVLHSTDLGKANISFTDNALDMNGNRNDNYFWANWKSMATDTYQQVTTVGYQRLAKQTEFNFNNTLSKDNVDDRIHDVFVLSHKSFLKIGNWNTAEFGGDLKYFKSHMIFDEIRYNTFESNRQQTVIDTIAVNSQFSTLLGGIYLQNTVNFSEHFHLTAGARLSYFNSVKNSVLVAPRLGVGVDLSKKITVRIGYGIYNQSAYPTETKIYDGQTQPNQDYKQSVHYTTSINYASGKTNLILNGYYKDNKKLYDDYRYDVFNRLGGGIAILDKSFITASGYSTGIEAILRHHYGKKSVVTASYAYAINKIRNQEGIETYRDNDRRHTFIINNLLYMPNNWTFSAYSIFYTGEPYTPSSVNFIGLSDEQQILFYNLGQKNSQRLPSFFSLDVRIDKSWHFRKWELNAYINFINLTSHRNVRSYFWSAYTDSGGNFNASKSEEWYLSKIFISPGVAISF